jgi:hypothetical protein
MDCVPELDGVVKSLYGAGDDHHRGLDFTVERMQVDVAFCCREQNKMKLTDISNVLIVGEGSTSRDDSSLALPRHEFTTETVRASV